VSDKEEEATPVKRKSMAKAAIFFTIAIICIIALIYSWYVQTTPLVDRDPAYKAKVDAYNRHVDTCNQHIKEYIEKYHEIPSAGTSCGDKL
jgi:hypothetical protein